MSAFTILILPCTIFYKPPFSFSSMYIDIHCHLEMCENLAAVMGRVRAASVTIMLAQGVKPEANRQVLELAKQYKEVKAALGLYPIDALAMSDNDIDREFDFIRKHRKEITAIGEVGLDYKEDEKQHDRQKYLFRRLIKLALELDKPLIIHSRKAEEETMALLEEAHAKKVILHCFSGKLSLIKKSYEQGWFLTVPTNVTFSEHFQMLAKAVPLNQLFCETDAPYLHPDKAWPNEPANVVRAYQMLAQLKGISLSDVEMMLMKNYERLFGRA